MHKSKLQAIPAVFFIIVAVLFVALFLYIGTCDRITVQETREPCAHYIKDNISVQEISDPAAPIGVCREFRWTLDKVQGDDATLAFYLVHQYARVYLDGELVYSLMPDVDNRIGKSISSNWIILPLSPKDTGKEMRVDVLPVYESVRNRSVEFHIGSSSELILTQLKKDLPQLVLAFLCIVLGLIVTVVQLLLLSRSNARSRRTLYLGLTVFLLGLWKITDTRFSPFLFENHTLLLGYMTIGALFLAVITFTLYWKECFAEQTPVSVLFLSLAASGVALFAFLCQITGAADLKETLPLVHLMLLVLIPVLCFTAFQRRRQRKTVQMGIARNAFLLLAFGAAVDLVIFFVQGTSSGLVFTLAATLLYVLILFIANLQDVINNSHYDRQTGLCNKGYWEALMAGVEHNCRNYGIIMLDLNGLKRINDTMGHTTGDKIIFIFSNLLRNTFPPTDITCRWGGDEFAVMVTKADRETVEQYLAALDAAVADYNASGETPALHYAAGYALSAEHPGLSPHALLQEADKQMYRSKKQWYAEHPSL